MQPEFSFISMPGGYAGLFRKSEAEAFEVLLNAEGRPEIFETSIQAIRAAKDHLAPKAAARSGNVTEDILGVNQWLLTKASQIAESRIIQRAGSFKPFVVERKRKGKRVVQT